MKLGGSYQRKQRGFTIVELLIVIVVIGILAAITIVAYNGIQNRAKVAALQSNLQQAAKKLEAYKITNNDLYPVDLATAGITVPGGTTYNYQPSGDYRSYLMSGTTNGTSYRVSNVAQNPVEGTISGVLSDGSTCPSGFIVVPGNSTFATSEFCVAKYEMRQASSTVPISQASGTPWVSISQTNAITYSANVAGCTGCHLMSEAEWLTLAQNVLSVGSNWSSGTVGTGYIYSGHNDNSPANAISATTDDSDGYNSTGNSSGNQRRTLTLTNGEVIWDMAGNVNEWTTGTIAGNAQPGLSGEVAYAWKNYNNGSLIQNGLPNSAYPSFGTPAASAWTSSQGIGQIYSNYGETGLRAFCRGGLWGSGSSAGVLTLLLNVAPSYAGASIGFRVAR